MLRGGAQNKAHHCHRGAGSSTGWHPAAKAKDAGEADRSHGSQRPSPVATSASGLRAGTPSRDLTRTPFHGWCQTVLLLLLPPRMRRLSPSGIPRPCWHLQLPSRVPSDGNTPDAAGM